jgi:di/tricarboxylate transporter
MQLLSLITIYLKFLLFRTSMDQALNKKKDNAQEKYKVTRDVKLVLIITQFFITDSLQTRSSDVDQIPGGSRKNPS